MTKTSGTQYDYVLTDILYRRLKGKGVSLICMNPQCLKPLKVGDKVVSRASRRKGCGQSKRYHKECWEALFNTFSQPVFANKVPVNEKS